MAATLTRAGVLVNNHQAVSSQGTHRPYRFSPASWQIPQTGGRAEAPEHQPRSSAGTWLWRWGTFLPAPSRHCPCTPFYANQTLASFLKTRRQKPFLLKPNKHFDRKPFIIHETLAFSLALTATSENHRCPFLTQKIRPRRVSGSNHRLSTQKP